MSDRLRLKSARAARAFALVSAALLAAGGCSGTRGGTSVHAVTRDVNGCASALPLARASVPARASLVEVQSLSPAAAMRILRSLRRTTLPGKHLSGRLCVVAYEGPFPRESVPLAPAEQGRFVVLVLTVRHPDVLALALLDRLPAGV
ncbi:MAG: hypothetical protein JWO12_2863 [Frankiales bacterium]|nr:hypothetical protein [Frankiales bacterium]